MPDTAVVDVDDLYCEEQIEKYLLPLHIDIPHLVVTAYAIPNKLGPVHLLADKYPWIIFGIHGWEHSQFETRSWTDTLARAHIEKAIEMGYASLFKAPNWLEEQVLEEACADLTVVLHHHEDYNPKTAGLLAFPGRKIHPEFESVHTHIHPNPSTDFIGGHAKFTRDYLSKFSDFATPIELAVEVG